MPLPSSAPSRSRSPSARSPWRRRWLPASPRWSAAASGWRGSSRSGNTPGERRPLRWARHADREADHPRRDHEARDEGEAEETPEEARRPRETVGELPPPVPPGPPGLRARGPHPPVRRANLGSAARPHERADPHDPDPEHGRHERREGVRGAPPRVPQRPGARGAQARHRLGRGRAQHGRAAGLDGRRTCTAARPHRRDPAGRPRTAEGAPTPGHVAPHPRAARRLQPRVPRRDASARGPRLADPDRRHRQEDRVDRARVLLRDALDGGRPPRGAGLEADRPPAAEGNRGPVPRPVPRHPPARRDVRRPRVAHPPRPGAVPGAEPEARPVSHPRAMPDGRSQGSLIALPRSTRMPNPQLDAILSDLLAADFAASPVSATGYGLTEYDDKLDDVSADALRGRDADAAAFLARLDAIGDEGLTTDEAIDRDLARAVLRGRLIMAPFEAWKRDPVTYSGPVTSGVFALFLHRLRPDAELAEAATARLDAVGPLVDAGIANLDPSLAHPLIVERGRNAAMGALRY